jgi:hypothetical protein
VGLGDGQVGVLPAHFFGRPTVGQIVHYELGDPNSLYTREPGRFTVRFFDMWISYCGWHDIDPG